MGSAEIYLFGGLLMAAYSVYSFVYALLYSDNSKVALSWASGDEPVKSKSGLVNATRPLVHQFTLKYAINIKNTKYRAGVKDLIRTSGLERELNVDEFIGLQILWGVLFPVVLTILNFALELDLSAMVPVIMIPLGVYGPRMYATQQKQTRQAAVRRDLPFFADMLALSTNGLDIVSAIKKIVDKAEESVLRDELQDVLKKIQLGKPRAESLREMAERVDIQEMNSFVAVIIDGEARGASVSQVLRDQSEQLRLERFVRAEKAGAKASQMILLPMVMFIFPAIILVVFGPMIVSMMGGK